MEILFSKKMYSSDNLSEKKIVSIKKKIRKWSPKLNLFLITLPIGNQGILEIYWYPELLQSFYREMDETVMVVGMSKSRDKAFELIEQIVKDIGVQDGGIPVNDFFKE